MKNRFYASFVDVHFDADRFHLSLCNQSIRFPFFSLFLYRIMLACLVPTNSLEQAEWNTKRIEVVRFWRKKKKMLDSIVSLHLLRKETKSLSLLVARIFMCECIKVFSFQNNHKINRIKCIWICFLCTFYTAIYVHMFEAHQFHLMRFLLNVLRNECNSIEDTHQNTEKGSENRIADSTDASHCEKPFFKPYHLINCFFFVLIFRSFEEHQKVLRITHWLFFLYENTGVIDRMTDLIR